MATEILIRVDGQRIVPATAVDQEILDGIGSGKEFIARLTSVNRRSSRQDRFYRGLLSKVVQNQDFYRTGEDLHFALKVALGYFDEIQVHDGKIIPRVKSVAHAKMDSHEFKTYLDAAIDLICSEIIPGMERNDLLTEIENMLGLSYSSLFDEKRS